MDKCHLGQGWTHPRPGQPDVGFMQLRQMIALALAVWHVEYLGVVPDQTTAMPRPGTSGINADSKPPVCTVMSPL